MVVVAGRRLGKTTVAVNLLLFHAVARPKQTCYYICPTLRQAEETAWRLLLEQTPCEWVQRIRRSNLEIELTNESRIKLHGPQSLRGAGLDLVVLDEFAFMPPKLWPEIVLPMLADRQGRALICSTPSGLNHFYDLFTDAQTQPEWATFQFPTREGDFVSESELELLRSSMDPELYAQEIEAQFTPAEGRIYQAFSRELNVREVQPAPQLKLLVGLDFNVDPMTAVVGQKIGNECHIFDEVVLRNSNTFEVMEELSRRFPQRGCVHPDPTGCARKTSAEAGVTDHAIIRRSGWDIYVMKPYPAAHRSNAVNAVLKNANGRPRLFIDPKCKNLIRSLEGLTRKEGTRIPDKSSGLDHAADALGYLVGAVFPMVDVGSIRITHALTGTDLIGY